MDIFQYAHIRGFNYQPSYAWNIYEAWKFFDEATVEREIGRGKQYFPSMNTIRIWLSYDAFRYQEDRQAKNFEKVLTICNQYGCRVVPVLFNCWHDAVMDAGGIYHTHMIEESYWCSPKTMYDSYIEKIVGAHKDDDRILAWDICNEPYAYGTNQEFKEKMMPIETAWLKRMSLMCKATGIKQPIGISTQSPTEQLHLVADFTDIYMVHPYYFYSDEDVRTKSDEGFDAYMQTILQNAKTFEKPVLTTETCWGSRFDDVRTEIIKRTLQAHNKANIGYIVHALNYSYFADLHDECDGPVGGPGNLAFVDKTGHIRKGHEIFNELAE